MTFNKTSKLFGQNGMFSFQKEHVISIIILVFIFFSLTGFSQNGVPEGMVRILESDFSNTIVYPYDGGSLWEYAFDDANGASMWDGNPNFSMGPKMQTILPDELPLNDYVDARIIDIGGEHGDVLQYTLYNRHSVSGYTANRMQFHSSFSNPIDSLYYKMDVYFPSDIKTSIEQAGTSSWFIFSEIVDPHIRFRINYVSGQLVFRAQNFQEDWYAPEPSTGWVPVQWDEWTTVEIMLISYPDQTGDTKMWITNNGVRRVAADVSRYPHEHPMKNSMQFTKLYTSDEIMDAPGADVWAWYDNLEVYLGNNDGVEWPDSNTIDTSNHAPVIYNQEFDVEFDDNANGSYNIGTVAASDPENDNLAFSITGGNSSGYYSIHNSTGAITVNNPDYFNSAPRVDLLTVRVTDDGPDSQSAEATITVTLSYPTIIETNTPPVIEDQEFIINESNFAGTLIGEVIASDPDEGQSLTYSITSGNEAGLFELDPDSGQLWITVGNIFELEPDSYTLNVKVEDDAEVIASDEAIVNVLLEKIDTIVYIDPDNINDSMEDGTYDHPFDSWQDVQWNEGCSYLQKRGTVANEDMKISIYANNILIGAYGEGEYPIIWSTTDDYALKAFEKRNITIENMYIIAENAISSIYFMGESCDNITVENSKIEGSTYGISIVGGLNYVIRYNTLRSMNEAIYSYAEQTDVYYNIFEGNQYAVHIDGENSASTIYNNVFYNNIRGVTTSYAELTLQNNIFYLAEVTNQALNFNGESLISDYNLYYPNQEGLITYNGSEYANLSNFQDIEGFDAHSMAEDPLFKDELNHDFYLELESPAIDAGTEVGITLDFMGEIVPFGDNPDIGAIEINEEIGFPTAMSPNNEGILYIFPNPTDGVVHISAENLPEESASLQIQDVNGHPVLQKEYENIKGRFDYILDISNLPVGFYILSLRFASSIYSNRLLKAY